MNSLGKNKAFMERNIKAILAFYKEITNIKSVKLAVWSLIIDLYKFGKELDIKEQSISDDASNAEPSAVANANNK